MFYKAWYYTLIIVLNTDRGHSQDKNTFNSIGITSKLTTNDLCIYHEYLTEDTWFGEEVPCIENICYTLKFFTH